MESRIIGQRAFKFACRIVKLCEGLWTQGPAARKIADQLFDSGTSIGANAAESQGGQTKPDFCVGAWLVDANTTSSCRARDESPFQNGQCGLSHCIPGRGAVVVWIRLVRVFLADPTLLATTDEGARHARCWPSRNYASSIHAFRVCLFSAQPRHAVAHHRLHLF